MKKLILFALALCSSVAMFAADVQIYFAPTGSGMGGWAESNAKTAVYYFKSADNTQNGWSAYMTAAPVNILTTTIPEGYDRVIFVRFDPARTEAIDWKNNWGQTVDLTLETGKDLFTITNDERDGDGKWKNGTWSVYVAPEKKDFTYMVKVPAGTTDCYIAGDWNGDGNWVFKQMTAVNAVDHQFEYAVTQQYESFEYKYCSAASWDNVEQTAEGGDVANRTYKGGIDEVAKFKTTPVIEDAKWFIMGSFNNWASGYELKKGENTALEVAITVEASKNYEFKIMAVLDKDSTWYGLPNEGNVMQYGSCTDWVAYKSEGESNQANVGLKTTTAGDYVFSVDVTNKDNDKIAPKFSVAIPEPAPDIREKREIVLIPGELKSDNPTMIMFAFTAGKVPFDATMQVVKNGEDTVAYKAEIPKELDSLIFVRAKDGIGGWSDLIWDGPNKNVWNQSVDMEISAECDTATFASWGEGENAKFTVTWCGVAPIPGGDTWYIKLPVAKDDWTWREMDEEQDGTWSHETTWVGGGANVGTSMDDATAKYIKDEEMDFGENQVAPAEGTACTFIWNPATQKLAVMYQAQGIDNISYEINLNAPMYNVLGVEVDATFHGVVIQNGHKFIR